MIDITVLVWLGLTFGIHAVLGKNSNKNYYLDR
jgi:hypothetical protein